MKTNFFRRGAPGSSRGWSRFRPAAGSIMVELLVAMSILAFTVIPVSLSHLNEVKVARIYYFKAVAMELVDGEMETLVAGGWRNAPEGAHPYRVRGESAAILPPGEFLLTRTGDHLRLEWIPKSRNSGGRVVREARGREEMPNAKR